MYSRPCNVPELLVHIPSAYVHNFDLPFKNVIVIVVSDFDPLQAGLAISDNYAPKQVFLHKFWKLKNRKYFFLD